MSSLEKGTRGLRNTRRGDKRGRPGSTWEYRYLSRAKIAVRATYYSTCTNHLPGILLMQQRHTTIDWHARGHARTGEGTRAGWPTHRSPRKQGTSSSHSGMIMIPYLVYTWYRISRQNNTYQPPSQAAVQVMYFEVYDMIDTSYIVAQKSGRHWNCSVVCSFIQSSSEAKSTTEIIGVTRSQPANNSRGTNNNTKRCRCALQQSTTSSFLSCPYKYIAYIRLISQMVYYKYSSLQSTVRTAETSGKPQLWIERYRVV